jgi:hypothetical protein
MKTYWGSGGIDPRIHDIGTRLSGQQAKLQWLQKSSQINGDNLNNVICEASNTFRKRKGNI